jgi:hypothetical protein
LNPDATGHVSLPEMSLTGYATKLVCDFRKRNNLF